MRELFLILRCRMLSAGRYLRAHAFGFLALGPLFLGGALWIAERYLGQYRQLLTEELGAQAVRPSAFGYTLALLLSAVALASMRRELYPLHTADFWLELLPVTERTRLVAAWLAGMLRLLPAVALILFLAIVALPVDPPDWPLRLGWLLRLLLVVPILALVQMLVALVAAHFSPWRGLRAAVAVLLLAALFGISFVAEPGWWTDLALWPFTAAALQLETVIAQAAGALTPAPIGAAEILGSAVTALALAVVVALAGLRWRRRDLEHLQRSGRRRVEGRGGRRFAELLSRLGRPVAAQLLRDLLLVLRRFSPAVDLALAFALLSYAGVVFGLPSLALSPGWQLRLAQLGCLLATAALSGVVPWLLEYQLPRFWIEKSTGVELQQIWAAKPWLARILALPTLLFGVVVLTWQSAAVAAPGLSTAGIVLSYLLAAWMVASTYGVAVFEVAERPLLGWLFSTLIGMAFAVLVIFVPAAWWLWAIAYIVVAGLLKERAARRVQLTEVVR